MIAGCMCHPRHTCDFLGIVLTSLHMQGGYQGISYIHISWLPISLSYIHTLVLNPLVLRQQQLCAWDDHIILLLL